MATTNPLDLYPVTIVTDRYSGCASGGAYLAFYCDPWDVPGEIDDADAIADAFWRTTKEPIGRGHTPQEALDDLLVRLQAYSAENDAKIFKQK